MKNAEINKAIAKIEKIQAKRRALYQPASDWAIAGMLMSKYKIDLEYSKEKRNWEASYVGVFAWASVKHRSPKVAICLCVIAMEKVELINPPVLDWSIFNND
jgi:hypothetical protein